ncbi:aldolase/citrate lyase family protein [Ramlibacter tataouinensis]|uniref:aldolase/citrate lyase family protein n=1 Tax=Ramlibacter tataouinensis TaxID=94132 RepID=UPI0022F40567|nr:aldolase/citrate lyase family protein [Ramlibacter tataouinensis]WBY00896.1 aldolase/citrate lyase family protein [Ramlibacter tataouinensis]
MLDLIQITNDPAMARRCDALEGMRLFVDLERLGKAERQAGRDTFISRHTLDDVARMREAVRRSRLMVRVNPLHAGSAQEIEAVLAQRPDLLMLPMFEGAGALQDFAALVAGRVPIVALLETRGALDTLPQWIATPGLHEIYVGLNDLHMSLGLRFMFEPLALGLVDRVAAAARVQGLRFGFGGIARLGEGLLPGRDVLAEHLRLGSQAMILSRTFHRDGDGVSFEQAVAALREAESQLAHRTAEAVQADALRIAAQVRQLAASLPPKP